MKKKKYAPATTGKVNLANVKSRINSGVSRGGGSLSRNKVTDQHSGEGTDQAGGKADLILRGIITRCCNQAALLLVFIHHNI